MKKVKLVVTEKFVGKRDLEDVLILVFLTYGISKKKANLHRRFKSYIFKITVVVLKQSFYTVILRYIFHF